MKKTLLLLLLSFCFFVKFVSAQDISLYVKKGKAIVSGNEYKMGEVCKVKSNESIKIETASLVIIRGNNSIAEVKPGNYSYKKLENLLPREKSFTESFINTAINQQIAAKRSAGVVTRGNNYNPWGYSPSDSLLILSDSLTLITGHNPLKLMSEIKMYADLGKDTIYLSSEKLTHKLKTPLEGNYCWEYEAKLGSKSRKYKNWFTVPGSEQKKHKLDAYHEFEKGLEGFSAEMRSLLIEEFLEANNIYLN
jgi:hypothetical protein